MKTKEFFRMILELFSIACFFAAAPGLRAASPPPILQNGGFDTGNFSGWTPFITPNGTVGAQFGFPLVGRNLLTQPSLSAVFEAGQVVTGPGEPGGGGGLLQTFTCVAGLYLISADVSSVGAYSSGDPDAGLFTLQVDQTTVATWDGGAIQERQTLQDMLSGSIFLTGGSHTFRFAITREGTIDSESPLQSVDNIAVTPAPEASTVWYGVVGLMVIICARPRKNQRLVTSSPTN
jgi:hypothetical protein